MLDGREKDWWYWGLMTMVLVSFGILLTKAVELMVVKSGYYQTLSRDNRIFEKEIPAARGSIVDRKGRVLAESTYQYFKTMEDGSVTFLNKGEYEGEKFEGVGVGFELKRFYPYENSMGLVTGYVGKVTEAEVNNDKCTSKLKNTDELGKSGVEKYFECSLRGIAGRRLVEVNAKGKYVREMGRQEPVEGGLIELSIDAFWQDKIYKLLEGRRAAIVISEPNTGKILALVSSPGYNPNDFSYLLDNNKISSYLSDGENLPLLNRTVAARYHPGSVFKPVMAVAGLEEGVINEKSTYEDTGVIKVGDYSYANWLWTKRGGTDGMVDIVKGIKRSNDIFFYKLGGDLGLERIKKWALAFGYGKVTGIELPGELSGLVPDEEWKLANKGEKWFLGNTYHLSIGQGDLGVTPLQVNQMTNVVANNGRLCKMSLLKNKKVECHDLGIKQSNLDLVKEGMRQACETGGTAWPLFNFKTKIGCKTGTAEVGDGSKDTHAWLTAFGPFDDPQISITVLVERGGEGSDVAAPIVGDILKEWFEEPNTVVPRYTVTPTR